MTAILSKDLLNRWIRLRERLEGYSERMVEMEMHIDWSDICVLDAYLSDEWEMWMGPKPTVEQEQ
jgi:hypothetical protein